MASISVIKPMELKTSRSGRLLIPRLRNWTGERVLVDKSGSVQVFGGSPDCTSTFVPERKLFNSFASPRLSQSVSNASRRTSRQPNKLSKEMVNESFPSTLNRQINIKMSTGKRTSHSSANFKRVETLPNIKRTSPRKTRSVSPSKPKVPIVKAFSALSPVEKVDHQRKSRSLTRKSSSSRSPARNRKRAVSTSSISLRAKAPLKQPSSVKEHDVPSSKSPKHFSPRKKSEPSNMLSSKTSKPIPTRSSPRKKLGVSVITSAKEHTNKAMRSSPRKKFAASPEKSPKEKENVSTIRRSSPRKKSKEPPEKVLRGKSHESPSSKSPSYLRKSLQKKINKPKKTNKAKKERKTTKETECKFDVCDARLQPVVRLVRLLPEEILFLTPLKASPKVKNTSKDDQLSLRRSSPRKRKSPTSGTKRPSAKKQSEKSPEQTQVYNNKTKSPTIGRKRPSTTKQSEKSPEHVPCKLRAKIIPRRRTVRETQKMLKALTVPITSNEVEDEAESTGAFFKNSRVNALKDLQEVDDILNNDFSGSDDNLSFRSIYERESSPMPAVPVSPISSFHETDAENSGFEDGLLGESPIARPTNFQKAQLLHRTLKNRELVTRKMKKVRKAAEGSPSGAVFAPIAKAASDLAPCPLLQPNAMRALEKNLKKKAIQGEKFHCETLYNGNTLQITLNSSDSETSMDSFDSDVE